MRTPDAVAIAAAIAIAIAGGLWLWNQNQSPPSPVVDTTPPIVVPLEHPPATGGNGEPPSTNQPQPEEPTDVIPLDHPPATGGGSGESPTNQPEPVVPNTTEPNTNTNVEPTPPWLRPDTPQPWVEPKPPQDNSGENTGVVPESKPNIHPPAPGVHVKPHKKPVHKKPHKKPHKKRPVKHYYCKKFCVAYKDHGYYYQLTPHNDW